MENEVQIKNRIDPVTDAKILKGALIAMTGAVAILVCFIIFQLGVDQAVVAAFISFAVPTLVNAYREYRKGVDPVTIAAEHLDQNQGQ